MVNTSLMILSFICIHIPQNELKLTYWYLSSRGGSKSDGVDIESPNFHTTFNQQHQSYQRARIHQRISFTAPIPSQCFLSLQKTADQIAGILKILKSVHIFKG